MKRVLEHEGNLLGDNDPPHDFVLGAPALLGIFFVLALACAACFGFGYSSSSSFGHTWHRLGQESASAAAPPNTRGSFRNPRPLGGTGAGEDPSEAPPETSGPAYANQAPERKPAPGVSLSTQASPAPILQSAQNASSDRQRAEAPEATERNLATEQPSTPLARRAVAAPNPPEAVGGAGLMVQIAAVTRAADAQTLANALRHDGFAAMVRAGTDDRFYHVQIGPFLTLQAAKAMRAHLVDSGYNAFIKP